MIAAETSLMNRHGAAKERLGGGVSVRDPQQFGEIVEVCRHLRMIRSEVREVDRQRAKTYGLNLTSYALGTMRTEARMVDR